MEKENFNPPTTLMSPNNHPIRGIGNDIIETARLRKSLERQGTAFLERLFTKKECDYCNQFKDPLPHFAGRFAAKEAIAKALGSGLTSKVRWHDIEIINDESGKPIVYLSEDLQKQFQHPQIIVSISHSEEYATAVALWIAS